MLSSSEAQGSVSTGTLRSRAAGLADGLCLAAAPAFAIMALLTAVTGGADMICSAMHHAMPLDGMATMYLLMSAFHLPAWLRLMAGPAGGSARS